MVRSVHLLPPSPPQPPVPLPHGEAPLPEALPSKLQKRFNGPVVGTVVVGEDFPEVCGKEPDLLFELVAPDGRGLYQLLSDDGAVPSAAKPAPKQSDTKPEKNKLLNKGGYVIFSDEYIQKHPDSSIAIITSEYQYLSPPGAFFIDPTLPPEKQQVEISKKFIKEAEECHRPLFRRKPSALVYGQGSYKDNSFRGK
ncbi:hypothetical protein AGDE_15842 [Angomonas deanei]|nr:hypothetical protein AGDE_15842 [Angomonas deanei]|eukprot:EPY18282.1 hypothetical protein AGDE_15842 [Angomonas deanei]